MKSFLKIGTCTLFLVTLLAGWSVAQQVQPSTRKYRVVAYKNGNPAVSSMSNTTEVEPYMSIYIPNSFTPNGDGMNDTFGIHGEAVKDFKMQVFNRWGQVIFETNNFNNRWDGTFDGMQVPQGSYIYRVSATGVTGKSAARDGTVNIIY